MHNESITGGNTAERSGAVFPVCVNAFVRIRFPFVSLWTSVKQLLPAWLHSSGLTHLRHEVPQCESIGSSLLLTLMNLQQESKRDLTPLSYTILLEKFRPYESIRSSLLLTLMNLSKSPNETRLHPIIVQTRRSD